LDDLGLETGQTENRRSSNIFDYPPYPSSIFSDPHSSSTDISIPLYSPTDSKAIEIKHDELQTLLVDLEDESRSKPVDIEEHNKQDNAYLEAWGNRNDRNGWSASWNRPVKFRTDTYAEELLTRETYKGPEVTSPGILAYGPFHLISDFEPSVILDYRVFIHSASTYDAPDPNSNQDPL
jgi:hypothetical protein